jgi:branched-chain amino acid aminotransferase
MNAVDNIAQLFPDAVVNINGEILDPQNAKISIFDRGFLYGDSIYEVTYSDNNSLLFFDEHLDRLFRSAELLNMQMFISRDEIISEALKTLKASKISKAYIRIVITRGETQITLDPNASFKNNLVIIVKPAPEYPQKLYNKGLHLAVVSVVRNDTKSTDPNAKSGNYLNNVMAIAEAKRIGADDAVMVNRHGDITEGSTFNIWAVKNGTIYTPPVASGLLKGITRSKVLSICKDNHLAHNLETFTPEFLIDADEVFITSSTKGIMPVYRINDRQYGENIDDWPHTQKLMKLYLGLVNEYQQNKKYSY